MKRIHSEQRRPNKKTQWEQLPAAIKAAQGFAENLVSEYATDSGINWEWLKYASIKQQDAYNADTLSMTAYSALISHQSPKGKKPLEILSWQSGMNLSGTETSKRILCYMLYTIFTEYKDKQQLATLRRELKEKPQSYGFDKIPAFAEKNFSPDALPPYDSIIAWAQLRAWMANAAGSNGLDGQMDSAIMNIFQEEAKLWPLQAGETIYAWLLNRIACLLEKKDLAGALNLTDFTLNLKATCLIPYYAQLQALQTGLLFLAGKNGACYSVLDNMQSSSVASSSTLQLMNSIDDPDKTKRIFKTMSIGKNLWLWYAWLKACQNINRKRAQLDFTNYTEKCVPHPHEARLLDALTK